MCIIYHNDYLLSSCKGEKMSNIVDVNLTTKATAKLKQDIENELKIADPKPSVAKQILEDNANDKDKNKKGKVSSVE